MEQQAKKSVETSELERILSFLANENNTLVTTILQLENIGHRVKNTNFPVPTDPHEQQENPDGLLADIRLQLSYMEAHNKRLIEYMNKMSALL
jgi:hypothetical protein